MPEILHHAPREVVAKGRLQHPVAKPHVVGARPPTHLRRADGELRAARRGDGLGHGGRKEVEAVRQVRPVVAHGDLGGARVVRRIPVQLDLRGAADAGVAPEVGVAGVLDVGGLEHVEGGDVGIGGGVGVPAAWVAVFVRVDEGDGVREGVVVFDEVGQVGEGLAALVLRGV